MLVTQVEMLLSHTDRAETTKMLDWLKNDEKFLFNSSRRYEYGLFNLNADWHSENIRVQTRCRSGPFIDFRFTLYMHEYPHTLAHILRRSQWKIKARFRSAWIQDRDVRPKSIRWDPWTHLCDPDFPSLWDPDADRARQEGRAVHHTVTSNKRRKYKQPAPEEPPTEKQLTALLVELRS